MKTFCKAAYLSAALVVVPNCLIGMGGEVCAMEGTAPQSQPITDEEFLNQLISELEKGGVDFKLNLDPDKKARIRNVYKTAREIGLMLEIDPKLLVNHIMPIIKKRDNIKAIYLTQDTFKQLNADPHMRYLFFTNLPSSVKSIYIMVESAPEMWDISQQMNEGDLLKASKEATEDYMKKGAEKKFLLGEITGPQIGNPEEQPLPEGVQKNIMEMMAETKEPHKMEEKK
jgi:hypothetical protein